MKHIALHAIIVTKISCLKRVQKGKFLMVYMRVKGFNLMQGIVQIFRRYAASSCNEWCICLDTSELNVILRPAES